MPSYMALAQNRRKQQTAPMSADKPKLVYRKKTPPTHIRSVWADNLDHEFALIRSVVARHPYASIDTEFPGAIHQHPTKPYYSLSPEERYSLLKANVDDLHLIQLGLTLSDHTGRLPDLGTDGAAGFVWEFNFRDFDVHRDRHNPKSIAFLQSHGIDLEKNRSKGVDSRHFAHLLLTSGLVCNGSRVSWVGFSTGYDFGYLIKVITRQQLPANIDGFLMLLRYFFGAKVFDIKYLLKFCGGREGLELTGGLEAVAGNLNVRRAAGSCHQAGSDSLLTWQAFQKMKSMFLLNDAGLKKHSGMLCGLQVY